VVLTLPRLPINGLYVDNAILFFFIVISIICTESLVEMDLKLNPFEAHFVDSVRERLGHIYRNFISM